MTSRSHRPNEMDRLRRRLATVGDVSTAVAHGEDGKPLGPRFPAPPCLVAIVLYVADDAGLRS